MSHFLLSDTGIQRFFRRESIFGPPRFETTQKSPGLFSREAHRISAPSLRSLRWGPRSRQKSPRGPPRPPTTPSNSSPSFPKDRRPSSSGPGSPPFQKADVPGSHHEVPGQGDPLGEREATCTPPNRGPAHGPGKCRAPLAAPGGTPHTKESQPALKPVYISPLWNRCPRAAHARTPS